MKRVSFLFGLVAFTGMLAAQAQAADILIGGHLFLAKAAGLVKVLSKDGSLMAGAGDPTMSGATLKVFDEGGGTNYTLSLPSTGWSGSAGSFKYKGAGSGSDPCKIVILKPGLLKAVCKGLSPIPVVPFTGAGGVVLSIDTDNYCLEFGGSEKKNTDKLVKRLDASAPAMCPSLTPPGCPLAAGQYTTTQVTGGQLKVYTFAAFPFPSGGTIVQDVAAASLPDCVHDTVVPYPGGFSAPNFCVPALGWFSQVAQRGCGVGKIDSNGGSDFTITEVNDTSDSSSTCNLPQSGTCTASVPSAPDTKYRTDITVGDGTADTCGSGTANVLVSVPVHTTTWNDTTPASLTYSKCNSFSLNAGTACTMDTQCTGSNLNRACTFQGGGCKGDAVLQNTDTVETQFDQILDFTTDMSTPSWSNIDGDAFPALCGGGPASSLGATGTCMDLVAMTVTTVASGGFASTASPYDGTFISVLPNTVALTGAFAGDTCVSPPTINFSGTATRCIP